MKPIVITSIFALSLTLAGESLACVSGAKCVSVPESQRTSTAFEPGDVLPSGKYQMMLNTAYYGLPPVSGPWRYYRVERDVYRVENRTLKVLERVTDQTNRAF